MRLVKYLLPGLIILSLCSNSIPFSEKQFTRVKVTMKVPERITEGKPVNFISDFYITYYKDYSLYELPYHETMEMDGKEVYDSVKYNYFICETVSHKGCFLKGSADSMGILINGDSLLLSNAYGGGIEVLQIPENEIEFKDSLISPPNKILRYRLNDKSYDSARLYFDDRLKNIPFSFSPAMDSLHNSKLCKIEFYLKHKEVVLPDNLKDFYINRLEMQKVEVKNREEVSKLFDRFILAAGK